MTEPIVRLEPLDAPTVWLRRVLLTAGIAALLALTWAGIETARTLHLAQSTLKTNSDAIGGVLKTADGTLTEVRNAAARLNDPARVARFDDYLIRQSAAALATSNNTRKVADNLNNLIRQDLRPMVADLRPRLNTELDEIASTTRTLNHQIETNGTAARALINEGRVTIVQSREQVVEILKSLSTTSKDLQVLVDDPALARMIENLNTTSDNLAGTTGHISVISGDLEGLSAKYLRPLYTPQKRSFFGKVGAGLITVFKYGAGGANLAYLISRF